MLREIGGLDRHAGRDRSGSRGDLAEHGADERRLARAIGAEDPHALAGTDIPGDVIGERAIPRGDRHVVELEDRLAQPGVGEGEQLHVVAGRGLALDELVCCIDAELRLGRPCGRPSAQPGKFLAQEVLPPSFRGSRLAGPLRLAQHEGGVAAVVLLDPAVDDLPRAIAQGVEEPAVVGDDDDRESRTRREVIGKPRHHFDVEVVGRLVEQEQVEVGDEGTGELDPPALPAGHLAELAIEQGFFKTPEQPVEDLANRGVARPLVHILAGHDVLRHGHLGIEGLGLRDRADVYS